MRRFLLFACLSVIAVAQSNAANPVRMNADFKQVKTSSLYKGERVAYGHFVYASPDYVKWEYTKPSTMCWETTDKHTNPMFASIVGVIKDCVNGNFESNRKFKIAKEHGVLTLTPVDKNISQAISKIVISLDTKSVMARTVAIHEKSGGLTVITFSNVKIMNSEKSGGKTAITYSDDKQ